MDNTLMTIIGIFLVVILIVVAPLMSITERKDDIAQRVVQTATDEFVDKISISGVIKPSDYEEYEQELASTGNTYEIEMEIQHLDENFGKKSGATSKDLIGENEQYSTFTTEILESMYLEDGTSENYLLKKGDNVIVTAKNTNKTTAQMLRTFIYKVTGKGTYQIIATSSSMVVNNGGKSQHLVIGDIQEPEEPIPEQPTPESPIPDPLFLYKNGEEYEEITGGWQPTIYSDWGNDVPEAFLAARYSKQGNRLYFGDELNNSFGNGAFTTSNKISQDTMNNYDNLCIKFKVIESTENASNYVEQYGRGNSVYVTLATNKPLFITYDSQWPTPATIGETAYYTVDGISGISHSGLKSGYGFTNTLGEATTLMKCGNALDSREHGAIWQSASASTFRQYENKFDYILRQDDDRYDQTNFNNYTKIGEELTGTIKLTQAVKERIALNGGCHIAMLGFSHMTWADTIKIEVYEVYLEKE